MNIQRRSLRALHHKLSRRDLLRLTGVGLSGLGLAAIVGCGSDDGNGAPTSTQETVADPPPETTTIRLPKNVSPRYAPFSLAGQFLPAEGFIDVQYIDSSTVGAGLEQIVAGEIDIGMPFPQDVTAAADRGDPLVVLAGLHNSGFVVFGNDRVQSLRELKGKRIWVQGRRDAATAYTFMAALFAYVDINLEHDVEFAELSFEDFYSQAQAGTIDAWVVTPPFSTSFRNLNIGHVVLDGAVDPPWSQYFGAMATGNRDFVEQHPAATKRALRAILRATDVCARDPERAARHVVDTGFTPYTYDEALGTLTALSYAAWREFNPEDTMRFYALRLAEAGIVKSTPEDLIERATDWHFLDEIKRELAVPA